MGIFDKLKKERDVINVVDLSETIDVDIFKYVDKNNWFQVFSACLGKMAVIQGRCEKFIISGQKWSADLAKGTITFGNRSFPLQIIGSEGSATNSWQWAYKNTNNFDNRLLELAHEVEKTGNDWDLSPLYVSNFELDEVFNGETLSTVACGISKSDYCYYRAMTQKGSVYLAFENVPKYVFAPIEISEFAEITASCLENYHVDHKVFVESFLLWNKTPYEVHKDGIVAHFDVDLYITFECIEGIWRVSELTTK